MVQNHSKEYLASMYANKLENTDGKMGPQTKQKKENWLERELSKEEIAEKKEIFKLVLMNKRIAKLKEEGIELIKGSDCYEKVFSEVLFYVESKDLSIFRFPNYYDY